MLVVTGAIIGLAPAVRLMRSDMKTLMNDSSRSASAGRGTARWLMAMTVAEVALAIMLVAGAGWLVRGFSNLRNTNAGFVADKRLLFDVVFPRTRDTRRPTRCVRHRLDLMTAVRNVHGVTGVGLVSAYPTRAASRTRSSRSFTASRSTRPIRRARASASRARDSSPRWAPHIIKGRDFGTGDLPNTVPVAIVNKVFVDRYLKGRDPIGVQFSAGYPAPDPRNEVTIVGVIDDVRQKSLAEPAEPAFYSSLTQIPFRRATAVVSMSQSDPGAVERAIRAEVRKLNPTMALDFELASDVVGGTLRRQELGMALMLIFGGMAIVLAAVGIYGVVSYAGSLRRDEMATRLALGASPRSVFLLVMRQGATLGLVGAAIGVGLAYFSGQVISESRVRDQGVGSADSGNRHCC